MVAAHQNAAEFLNLLLLPSLPLPLKKLQAMRAVGMASHLTVHSTQRPFRKCETKRPVFGLIKP